MNKTMAVVGLDFNLVKPYTKGILFLLALGIAMGVFLQSASAVSSYFIMALMLIMSYPFAVSEKNGLDILYGTLSINKNDIVTGRYLFVLFLEVIFAALAFLCAWVLSAATNIEFNPTEQFLTLSLLSGVFSIIVAIQYPIYFKMGYTKGKIIALLPLLIAAIAVLQLPALAELLNWNISWKSIFASIVAVPSLMYVIPVIFGLLCLSLSYLISCKIYSKRDI